MQLGYVPAPLTFILLFLLTHSGSAAPDVVINEIHYDPEIKTEPVEFVELYNAGDETADLSGWAFTSGIDYIFPEETTLDPDAYLVITENKTAFDQKYGSIFASGKPAFDQWTESRLSNEGETITLNNASGEEMETVTFRVGFPWPVTANGEGASMELLNPSLDNDLGGSWAASSGPTPNEVNSVFIENPAPQMRQVEHLPQMPKSTEETRITVKVTDPDGVASVEFHYQIVQPGQYLPGALAKDHSTLLSSPNTPLPPNPDFEDSANWETMPMMDDGTGADEIAGDDIYTVTLPPQGNRHLVRYRITATDSLDASVRAPFADDPSLNFAYFSYDGVPDYEATQRTAHPDGAPYTHPKSVLTSIPVYFLLTDEDDFTQCLAYNGTNQIPSNNYDARSAFNWPGTFIYEGIVYDHMRYRLRQRNDRYGGSGKRSMRFRFNRGYEPQFHDLWGEPYPRRWRTLNSSKMTARGGANFGLHETMNNMLWNLYDVPAPHTHWFHMRVIKARDEVPQPTIFGPAQNSQYLGDFFGLHLAIENYDSRFLDGHGLPDGNLYKLKSYITDGTQVQRVQGRDSVTDGSDFSNIINNLRRNQSDEWLNTYVNYDHWNRYHTVVEAVRHFDVQPNIAEHLKNRSFYFRPDDSNPWGKMHTLPWDSDTSWGPNWNAGEDYAKQAVFSGGGRPEFLKNYRNRIREFRDLVWQEDQIEPMLDRLHNMIGDFVLADRDRWTGAPAAAGSQTDGPIEPKIEDMKRFAFVGGSWTGGNDPVGESRDSGISGQEGRDDYLDWLGNDGSAPGKPQLTYIGDESYSVDDLRFHSSDYATSIFSGAPFAAMEWRLAEITDPTASDYDPTEPFKWEWNANWNSGPLETFEAEMHLPATEVRVGRTYRVRVRMIDEAGRWSSWSDPIQFTAAAPEGLAELIADLRITEIMYHPTPPTSEEAALGFEESDFEYLELYNAGSLTLDLTQVRFTKGIDFDFMGSTITSLAPGETVIVVSNIAAFTERYGSGHPVAGEYVDQNLSNAGENLKLSFGGGTPIIEFDYGDRGGWPGEADGSGKSLILIDPSTGGDYQNPTRWAASPEPQGSPGTVSGSTPPPIDSDGDGQNDESELLAGTDPQDPLSHLHISSLQNHGEFLRIQWASVPDKTYAIEYAPDLQSQWTTTTTQTADTPQSQWEDHDPDRLSPHTGYYRIRVITP